MNQKTKLAAIPDEPDACIQFHDWPYIAYQEITLTKNFDIYFNGIIRSETAEWECSQPLISNCLKLTKEFNQ